MRYLRAPQEEARVLLVLRDHNLRITTIQEGDHNVAEVSKIL